MPWVIMDGYHVRDPFESLQKCKIYIDHIRDAIREPLDIFENYAISIYHAHDLSHDHL